MSKPLSGAVSCDCLARVCFGDCCNCGWWCVLYLQKSDKGRRREKERKKRKDCVWVPVDAWPYKYRAHNSERERERPSRICNLSAMSFGVFFPSGFPPTARGGLRACLRAGTDLQTNRILNFFPRCFFFFPDCLPNPNFLLHFATRHKGRGQANPYTGSLLDDCSLASKSTVVVSPQPTS